MTFYSRNGILYVRINSTRLSTKMTDTLKNRRLVESYYRNDEFFNKFEINKQVPTVLELCEEVLKQKEKTLKSSSYRCYLSMYKSNIETYFTKEISYYKAKHIEKWYSTFTDKQSILTCEAILKPAFDKALIREYIKISPFLIKKPKLISSYEIRPFTIDEVKMIIDYTSNTWFGNFFSISVFTGLRTGELLALKWSDINFKNMTISVNRTFSNGYESTPKTKSSKAVIDLPFEAIEYFRKQRLKTGLKEYVFYSEFNKVMKQSHNLNRLLKRVLSDLHIEARSMYQTRHTFASLKLSYGERLEWVAYMLRHKDTSITLRKYFKYMPNKIEKRVIFDLENMVTQKRHTN